MTPQPHFRPYQPADRPACLVLFDENCPAYFAPNERDDYAAFLDRRAENYLVCVLADRLVGAYGLYPVNNGGTALHWILLSSSVQGLGLGSIIMSRAVEHVRDSGRLPLLISASHKSAPFFARFGAIETSTEPDGWGPGMHRVEMQLAR
jgi:GNAT superfamily N-acetyltransferase